ncbi:hypothetical protein AQUCO_00100547v1 [Aquilegia coerulea]|uniref:EGF-like domain-containing protein n=1 Tax=Aquilegia coerulea TaxID=218851 RepID=A0A2G5FAR1_AQUCA|nr:hypothetical protein AQUCO_00100547v1 [Aquilegia coerulea]
MAAVEVFLLLFLLQWIMLSSAGGISGIDAKPGCQSKCGNVSIRYPFGVGKECSIGKWTNVTCNTTFNPPKLFLDDLELLQISDDEIRVKTIVVSTCSTEWPLISNETSVFYLDMEDTPFTLSTKNKFTVIGCDFLVRPRKDFNSSHYVTSCVSTCGQNMTEGSCFGIGCCQSPIPRDLQFFSIEEIRVLPNYTDAQSSRTCNSVFLAEEDKYSFKFLDFYNISSLSNIPMVVNWVVANQTCEDAQRDPKTFACKENSDCYHSVDGNGYLCNCSNGYEGNPYLGCQGMKCELFTS